MVTPRALSGGTFILVVKTQVLTAVIKGSTGCLGAMSKVKGTASLTWLTSSLGLFLALWTPA